MRMNVFLCAASSVGAQDMYHSLNGFEENVFVDFGFKLMEVEGQDLKQFRQI